jgi:hypothetical protein
MYCQRLLSRLKKVVFFLSQCVESNIRNILGRYILVEICYKIHMFLSPI